eukprot:15006040-Alexandrium_andersonii.AAC.1
MQSTAPVHHSPAAAHCELGILFCNMKPGGGYRPGRVLVRRGVAHSQPPENPKYFIFEAVNSLLFRGVSVLRFRGF